MPSVEAAGRLFADLQLMGMPAVCSPVRGGLSFQPTFKSLISGITHSTTCWLPEIVLEFWFWNKESRFPLTLGYGKLHCGWRQFPVLSLPNSHVTVPALQGRRPGCSCGFIGRGRSSQLCGWKPQGICVRCSMILELTLWAALRCASVQKMQVAKNPSEHVPSTSMKLSPVPLCCGLANHPCWYLLLWQYADNRAGKRRKDKIWSLWDSGCGSQAPTMAFLMEESMSSQ